jgi:hypothetical protein
MPKRRVLAAVFSAAVALPAAAVGAFATMMAFQSARLPYNSEGRYFDGVVVHHDGAQFVYGALALVAWAITGCAVWAACRLAKPRTSFRQA